MLFKVIRVFSGICPGKHVQTERHILKENQCCNDSLQIRAGFYAVLYVFACLNGVYIYIYIHIYLYTLDDEIVVCVSEKKENRDSHAALARTMDLLTLIH